MPKIEVETLKLKDNEQSTVPHAVVGYVPRGVSADNIRQVEYELAKAHGMMNWEGGWVQGCYEKNDVVVDDEWTTIANKDTCDRPAPQPIGDVEVDLPEIPDWTIPTYVGTVRSGHDYVFKKAGWANAAQVWVPEVTVGTTYRLITLLDGTYKITPLANLIAGRWNDVAIGNRNLNIGAVAGVYLESINSGGTTQVTGGWTRQTDSNNNNPTLSGYNHDNNNTILRIDKTDLDSVGRETELLSIIAGSTIQFVDTTDTNRSITYYIETVTDNGTAIVYSVLVEGTGVSGEPLTGNASTMTATIPVPQATKYVEIVDWWVIQLSFATITGYESLDGIEQALPNNAYGVRIVFQEAYVSPDWDLVASSSSSSSATTSSGSVSTLAMHEHIEVNVTGAFPTRANIENGLIALGYLPPYDSGQIVAVDGAKSWLVEYIQSIDKMYATKLTEI